jgi:hypothetical protein
VVAVDVGPGFDGVILSEATEAMLAWPPSLGSG